MIHIASSVSTFIIYIFTDTKAIILYMQVRTALPFQRVRTTSSSEPFVLCLYKLSADGKKSAHSITFMDTWYADNGRIGQRYARNVVFIVVGACSCCLDVSHCVPAAVTNSLHIWTKMCMYIHQYSIGNVVCLLVCIHVCMKCHEYGRRREKGERGRRDRRREGKREGGREGGKERGREGQREGGREGGRERGREGGRERGRERGMV